MVGRDQGSAATAQHVHAVQRRRFGLGEQHGGIFVRR